MKSGPSIENRLTLRAIREREVEQIVSFLPPASAILEIGAGAGWQAQTLARYGHRIDAIDLPRSKYGDAKIWPVIDYDGVHIPFPAEHFDVVFSSNVLEHVESLEVLMKEMRRVLKPSGIAVHLLPTSSWRFWATISHYLLRAQQVSKRILGRSPPPQPEYAACSEDVDPAMHAAGAGTREKKRRLLPPPHGAKGNCITEIYWFSRGRWLRFFQRNGWRVIRCAPNRLFYTRVLTLRPGTQIDSLRRLSYVLGSSCLVYVLQPEIVSK